MNHREGKAIFLRLTARGFFPAHVAEVGVFHPESSNVYDYVLRGVRCTLVEPDPESIARIRLAFGAMKHVTLHPVAIHERAGTVSLTQRASSSFLSDLATSPAIANDGVDPRLEQQFTVSAVTFDHVDDGTIDLLSVDIEGAEWYVLSHMVSRPAVVSVETHGGAYINPRLAEIRGWMAANGYVRFYVDRSDTVYVQPGRVRVTTLDRLRALAMDSLLAARRERKKLLRSVLPKAGARRP
jgi:FkbM family methyltransferase